MTLEQFDREFDLDVRISTPSQIQETPLQPNFLTIGSTCGSCGGGYPCHTWATCYSQCSCAVLAGTAE